MRLNPLTLFVPFVFLVFFVRAPLDGLAIVVQLTACVLEFAVFAMLVVALLHALGVFHALGAFGAFMVAVHIRARWWHGLGEYGARNSQQGSNECGLGFHGGSS
ncbi:hypothetical protein ACS7SF_24040 (plasmid) [Ralstonia sp. 25C]|uniref:hypothetical protein n=1 Tax=Ralstonia sp. 25C TaxID=3447363 RepID=UPI003F74D2E9